RSSPSITQMKNIIPVDLKLSLVISRILLLISHDYRLADGGRMLWLLFCLLPLGGSSSIAQEVAHKARHNRDAAANVTGRPQIYYCRSPNMEDFTCWWHPLDNLTAGEEVTYVFTYSKDKGPKHECPDYKSAGPNSCHFDKRHTSIWTLYCMNVTAVTAQRNYSSQKLCLDVADIGKDCPTLIRPKQMKEGR
ncbi:hypothetical protein XENOCAPTIV_030951, partial [Xenoophorus captivus]